MLTLTNDFHDTEARVRIDVPGAMTYRQYKRAWKTLCGIADCRCGGIRGPQWHNGRRIALEDQADGTIKIYYA